jgi:flavin-dependent dehydrogenase
MRQEPLRVAIVGAGPAGSALAILLARRGAAVTLFADDRRPSLLVGESLVPAVVPILQTLGVEKQVAEIGHLKPGVSFIWSESDRFGFTFARFAPAVFPYAYNVPRPAFDEVLTAQAVADGVSLVFARARLVRNTAPGGAEILLGRETLAAAPALEGRQPDLLVDATGRARHGARVLGIDARVGPRKDVAHFAHFERCRWVSEPQGQVLIARGAAGWSWCIPLKDRVSVGIVVDHAAAARLGRTPEERLTKAIATDPWLSGIAGDAQRATPVATYANYQLISRRGYGPGWAAVGDAFGFVDPMLSPGVFLSLRSAAMVADALAPVLRHHSRQSPSMLADLFRPYAMAHGKALAAWMELVGYFYDGRLIALMCAGRDFMGDQAGRLKGRVQDHIERHIALQASGARTTARYSRGLLRFLSRHAMRGIEPEPFAIR